MTFTQLCRQAIQKILKRENLTSAEMESLFDAILTSPAESFTEEETVLLAGFLLALAMKGETVQELVGAARGMRRHAERIQVVGMQNAERRAQRSEIRDQNAENRVESENHSALCTLHSALVDIVGTGGDSLHTFNVSTTSAFVAAGAGLVVAKHGNRAVSSRCGSADVLERCGVNLQLSPERVEEMIAEIGIGFLFAQRFHPAMRRVAPIRKMLGIRTLFNMLGPLTNPAGASCVLLGVYDARLTEVYASALSELGCRRAMVVHGYDGMDELTMTTRSRVTEFFDGRFRTYDFFPELYFDGELATPEELLGGDVDENAAILQGILNGTIHGGKRNIVLLNTAAALVCAERSRTMEEGIKLAEDSIDSGAAYQKLTQMKNYV
jgi:anthranilate phosphoribosyltransferase